MVEEFHDAPVSGIACEADTPQRLRTPIWRKEIAIPIVLGNFLGLYLNSGLLMGVAVFFFQTDQILLLVSLMALLYAWYRYIFGREDTENPDWPGACFGGILFGLVTAYMHLLTKVTVSVNLDDPTVLLISDPDLFTRVMAPDLSILPGHFNSETLLVFFTACLLGVVTSRLMPRRVSVLLLGVILLFGYLWARERILSTPEHNLGAFAGRSAGGRMDWRLEMLGIGLGNGLAVFLLGGAVLLDLRNVRRFLSGLLGTISAKLPAGAGRIVKERSKGKPEYSRIRRLVIWGWVLGIIVTYNFNLAMFLPDFFMGAFLLIVVAILFQSAMIHQFTVHDKKDIPYRIVSLLGGVALGTAFVTIPRVVYDGLSSQRFFVYLLDAATATKAAAILFILGLLLGTLLLITLSKNKALLIYGLCMFIPACIAVCPPVMAFYIGPGSFVGLAYALYLPILYLPVGASLACIVVGIHNMRQERRIREESATN